jgi:two-component system C4-dicarboxylate transport response regulator DctD
MLGAALAKPSQTLSQAVEDYERALISAELARQNGNIARSGDALGVPRTTLHDKMRKYGLG